MKLEYLYNMSLIDSAFDSNYTQSLKKQDPNTPETSSIMPIRSGSQDTPLNPRHRIYFNAPIGGTQEKSGFADQSWFNIKALTPSSSKIRPYSITSHH